MRDRLTWQHLAVDFDLIRLHRLLDNRSDVSHPDVDTSFLHSEGGAVSVRGEGRIWVELKRTRMPVLVASLTASSKLSYVGSQLIVNAESTILPCTWMPKSTLRTSPEASTAGAEVSLGPQARTRANVPFVSPALGL